jgi:hypothetical protein
LSLSIFEIANFKGAIANTNLRFSVSSVSQWLI